VSFAGRRRHGTGKQFICRWRCRCDCGDEAVVDAHKLKGKPPLTKSCGCLLRGKTVFHQRERAAWCQMIEDHEFKVCERWKRFANFFEDMGERPTGLSLIRRDDELGFTPENCLWAKWGTTSITFEGETLPQAEWARRVGIPTRTIARRLQDGWSAERALTIPVEAVCRSDEEVIQIREDRAAGMTMKELEEKYGVGGGNASAITTGRIFQNVEGPRTKHVPTHHSKRPEYNSWLNMIDRCYNPNSKCYAYYGGHEPPVTVCKRWRDSFESFFTHVGPRSEGCTSIDRWPDNDGNYEPGNVRWATAEDQARNRRDNLYVTYKGRKTLLRDLARHTKVSYNVLYYRIRTKGWDVMRAVTEPPAEGGGKFQKGADPRRGR
jgi:hypothetical protein